MTKKIAQIAVVGVVLALLFGLGIWMWVKAPDRYSDAERRLLAEAPTINADTVWSGKAMQDVEPYLLDQFPMRDTFRSVKALASGYVLLQMDNNGIYQTEGHLAKLEYPETTGAWANAADYINGLVRQYANANNVYLCVVPDKNVYLAPQSGRLHLSYDALVQALETACPACTPIHIWDALDASDYYVTDTHWKQTALVPVAQRIAAAMGVTLSDEYQTETLASPFYGVLYGQTALPHKPDTLAYLNSAVLEDCVVTNYDTGVGVDGVVYDLNKATGKDPYELFLMGNSALITIENPSASTDRTLVVFRDSFGSSLIPLLVSGYSKITLVDTRYVASAYLTQFGVEFENAEVLFLYSTLVLNSSSVLR